MQKLVVINVLAKHYYDDCHIIGSINIPLEKLEWYAKNLNKKIPIVVYCASYKCPVSEKAWHLLNKLEFESVWAYEGGIAEWNQKGYPCAGVCQEEYLSRQEGPEDRDIRTLTAEELKEKMEEAGLL